MSSIQNLVPEDGIGVTSYIWEASLKIFKEVTCPTDNVKSRKWVMEEIASEKKL